MTASNPESVRYFSNGTEGRMWMAEWCDRCTHDHGTHREEWDAEDGCPHLLNTLSNLFDPVFIRTSITLPSGYEFQTWDCVEFSRCPCDNGPDDPGVEPTPIPDPNQGVLFNTTDLMPGVWRDVVLDELGTVAKVSA